MLLPSFLCKARSISLKFASSNSIILYSLPILGRECASELVKKVYLANSFKQSAISVSALKPNSIAGIFFKVALLNISGNLLTQFP
ncbi:hypothetical protein ES708_31906 [subsurface metagenome]